jgi:hypothetical protein
MADFARPLHRRIARLLSRMDVELLRQAECYFGGATQLAMSYGEYRESRDLDFLVSTSAGYRLVREGITERSLGPLFKQGIVLAREVRAERDAIRTFIKEAESAEPIKFEIILEARIPLSGRMDSVLGVPILNAREAVAEKFMANDDRGRGRETLSRDVFDLAFVSLQLDDETLAAGYDLAVSAYGTRVMKALVDVLRMLELDAAYRARCLKELDIKDDKQFREGVQRLQGLKKLLRSRDRRKASSP